MVRSSARCLFPVHIVTDCRGVGLRLFFLVFAASLIATRSVVISLVSIIYYVCWRNTVRTGSGHLYLAAVRTAETCLNIFLDPVICPCPRKVL
jgi:hypothetical protein